MGLESPANPSAMPALVHLNPDADAALVVLEGTVRWNHIVGAMLGVYDRPDSTPEVIVLWDARGITSLDLPPESVAEGKALLERLAPALDGGRSAFVVRREIDGEIALLLTRIGPRRRRECGVFYRIDEAVAFLGLPDLDDVFQTDADRVLKVE